ncbi:LPXTG cell wall anchor domain-containing protein [Patescibacteria group bacterium]
MKKLVLLVFTLFTSMLFSGVVFAQEGPPEIVDPFATEPAAPEAPPEDEAPPALTLPAAEPPAEEPPPAAEPPAEEPPPAEEAPPAPAHAAAPAPSYSGGRTVDSGPGLALIGLGSLLGAGLFRRKKK